MMSIPMLPLQVSLMGDKNTNREIVTKCHEGGMGAKVTAV